MRILMTTDAVGGVWTYTTELVSGLLEKGCSIFLLVMGPRPDSFQGLWLDQTTRHYSARFRYLIPGFHLEWMVAGSSAFVDSHVFIQKCIDEFLPDLLHSNQFCYGALATTIPKLVVAHSDVHSWAIGCGHKLQPSAWLQSYDLMVTSGLKCADAVVAPTRWMANQLAQLYQFSQPALVIPNGRNFPVAPAKERKLQALSCGRIWDKAKNIPILEEVADMLPIFVAGSDLSPDGGTPKTMTKIRHLGSLSQEQLACLMSESSIYIATSCYEPFGLAPIEAALTGCGIVANSSESFQEVWGNSANYYSFNDASSLRDVLQHLLDFPEDLKASGDRSRLHAESHYGRSRMTEAYLGLYRDLCNLDINRAA